MGAAASIELQKPVDASDIRSSDSLEFAKSEVIRLRSQLGHLAKLAGVDIVVYDASDIVLGIDEREDFERCVAEVIHIRKCLQLHTLTSRRKTRVFHDDFVVNQVKNISFEEKYDSKSNSDSDSDSDSDSSSSDN